MAGDVLSIGRRVPTMAMNAGGTIEIGLLGTLRVRRADGSQVDPREFRTCKTRHLLRLLALQDGKPVRAAVLTELLWPDVVEDRARASLRTAASQLRKVLAENRVLRVGDGLALVGVEVDALEFERETRRARTWFAAREDVAGLDGARSALARYAGDLADDEPGLDPLHSAGERLALLRRELMLDAAGAAVRVGRSQEAIELAGDVAEMDPACERACCVLIDAHLRLGERASALRAYERCRRSLVEELGVEPLPRTQRRYLQLLDDQPRVAVS